MNRGIKAAETHDVVLLHSDTEVPAGWLRRLAAHAWSHPAIGTVSPLSNHVSGLHEHAHGTPDAGQPDKICRDVNAGRCIRIPAATPSCMYVRRDTIRAVGDFRSTSGSAEDFCLRATAAGWQHRLACDVFVHQASLVDAWPAAAKAASAREHPGYDRLVDQHKTLAPADPHRFAVTAALFRQSRLPVILMVSHDMGGGVRRHINSLAARYRGAAHVLLLEGSDRGVALSVPNEPRHPVLTLPSHRVDDLVLVLDSAGLSRVHIHHLLHMEMDLRRLIHRLGVPFDVTVHDYFAICPQINLLKWSEGLYCGEPDTAGCNACIASLSSHGAKDIVSWRREKAWQFIEADRVICPSTDVKARLSRYGVDDNAVVAPHEAPIAGHWPISRPVLFGAPLRIVLLGVLANHKGARIVAAVAEAAPAGSLEIHLIGYLEENFPEPAAKLIRKTGKYREEDLDGLLRRVKPHVFWFPSSAPETYSYTLSTAIACGLPIVAASLGSFPERLAGRPDTWLIDHRAGTEQYLAIFDEVSRSLQSAEPPPVQRGMLQGDFYATHYLRPARVRSSEAGSDVNRPLQPKARSSEVGSNSDVKRPLKQESSLQKTGAWGVERPASKPRLVIIPERLPNGSLTLGAYIRLLLPLDDPAIGGGFDIIMADADTVFDHRADIIATQRLAIPDIETAERLADHARRTGTSLLYDLDDDLLNIPADRPDARHFRGRSKLIRRMLTIADNVWLATDSLADRLASLRPDATVMENRLDARIWTSPRVQRPAWDDPVRILCMGARAHDANFALIEPALTRLKAEYGNRIVIDVLGVIRSRNLPAGLNWIGPSPHGTRSYPAFVEWVNGVQPAWHIGLAPLLDTPFNRCKSPIKVLDYAALGLVTLASDMPVYRGSIADGPGGQLVRNNPQAWYAALDWLIRDQSLRRSLADNGKQVFLRRGTLLSQAEQRRGTLTSLLQDRQPVTGLLARRHVSANYSA